MATITDEYMQQELAASREYCIVILRAGPQRNQPGVEKILWEHARRNFSLRAGGLMPIVFAVRDPTGLSGIGVFTGSVAEVKAIMDEDPGVKAGVFVYEVHTGRSFPGDSLPAKEIS